MTVALERNLARGLAVVLGLLYLVLGMSAHGLASLLGIVGGLVVVVIAVAMPRRPAVMIVGVSLAVIPFAAATWWSIVTPLLAVVTIAVSACASATRGTDRRGFAVRRSAA